MNSFTHEILDRIGKNGYTDIWFTGLIAHASQSEYNAQDIAPSHPATVKGKAGSPYAIRDYYDIDPDLAESVPDRMAEFQSLIERVHASGLRFIMDFVPNHVARQYHSSHLPHGIQDLGENDDENCEFSPSNNFYHFPGQILGGDIDWNGYREFPARATGNNRFNANPGKCDWYETIKLNYGIDWRDGSSHFDPTPDTWTKMTDILLFWAGKGVDAFRCDMAEMVPVEFWHYAIRKVKSRFKKVEFIAEIYNPGLYSSYIEFGGFDWLYDKVGLYDTLRAVVEGRESATAITRCWQSTGSNGSHMLHFMENHDEQRISSDFFAGSPSKALPAMAVSALMDICPVMVYAGQELGEKGMDEEGFSGVDGRTTIFDYWAPDTLRRQYNDGRFNDELLTDDEKSLKAVYSKLMNIARKEKSISNGRFFDLMYVNPTSETYNPHVQYSFLRSDGKDTILIVTNFSSQNLQTSVFIPQHAFDYLEMNAAESCRMTDLMSGKSYSTPLLPDSAIRFNVPANSFTILKWKNI